MYDNIRLIMSEPFRSETERTGFISRFALFVQDDKKGIFHNKGYETLEQNKGIYIRLEAGTGLGRGRLTLSFSLHKFYNAMRTGKLFNYNPFNFEEANEASRMLSGLLGLDLSGAVVKKYEIGINVPTEKPPETYMKELDYLEIKGRQYRIIEDRKHKEYKLYGTHSEKGKRIVYVFYDKTYEARSKIKDEIRRQEVPENILRVEMDVQRPSEKVLFSSLFTPAYQAMLLCEFRQRFTGDLRHKMLPVKKPGVSKIEIEIYGLINKDGASLTIRHYKELAEIGNITLRQYKYYLSKIKVFNPDNSYVDYVMKPCSKWLSERIEKMLLMIK